jgi:hypothetical protein
MSEHGTGAERTFWKRCSSCKKELGFGTKHYLCSVSTCRGKRTGLVFCSVPCWDAHLGFARHRSSFAEEATSPSKEEFLELLAEDGGEPVPRKIIVDTSTAKGPSPASGPVNTGRSTVKLPGKVDTLVVVSKVKKLIHDLSEFNTSQCAIDALTERVAAACAEGIDNARTAGRKTVMGRDFRKD